MTEAQFRAALRRLEGDLMSFGLEELELEDTAMVTLSEWWRDQISRVAAGHLAIGLALADAAGE